MATTVLNTSFVDPNAERVSVARIGRMAPPVSLRAMIERRDRVRVARWGVCTALFPGATRATALDNAALERIFGDMETWTAWQVSFVMPAAAVPTSSGTSSVARTHDLGAKKKFALQGTEIEEYRKIRAIERD
jgi:hypothetical protein